jgi:hypothetical protein
VTVWVHVLARRVGDISSDSQVDVDFAFLPTVVSIKVAALAKRGSSATSLSTIVVCTL